MKSTSGWLKTGRVRFDISSPGMARLRLQAFGVSNPHPGSGELRGALIVEAVFLMLTHASRNKVAHSLIGIKS
jgi:hypothetical protein